MNVSEVMRRDVEFISPDATVQEAAQMMGELDVSALPVGSREDLRGIVTERDILLRVCAKALDCAQVKVHEIMSSSMFSCREEDSLEDALESMVSHDVRRLPVVNGQGHVTGWVTLAHISRNLLVTGQLAPQTLEEAAKIPQ